jgi:hypothetical protein
MSAEKVITSLDKLDNNTYESIKYTGLNHVLPIDKLKALAQCIKEEGVLKVETEKLEQSDLNKLKTNLRVSGYITKEEDGLLICTRKVWAKKSENPWKLIKLEEKAELVLEKELVDPNAKYEKFSKDEDCITKPKPCKNCTCWRAEENKEKVETVSDMKSGCGKCYLGDAYRCAGCPFRGLPAFEPGDKIEIKNVQVQEKVDTEKSTVNVTGSTVKLDI